MARPQPDEYGSFYQGYIDKVEGDEALKVLENSMLPLEKWLLTIKHADMLYQYAPGKWTIGQLLQHIIDTERIFGYRALCIARGEKQVLPGFEENDYAEAAPASHRDWHGLSNELMHLRLGSVLLYRDLDYCQNLGQTGIASGFSISVNAIAFIMVGHLQHHMTIIDHRYIQEQL